MRQEPKEYCASGNHIEYLGKVYCMPGDISNSRDRDQRAPDFMCSYMTWANPDNITHYDDRLDNAKCGVNKQGFKYCNVRKGDAQYANYLYQMQRVL